MFSFRYTLLSYHYSIVVQVLNNQRHENILHMRFDIDHTRNALPPDCILSSRIGNLEALIAELYG